MRTKQEFDQIFQVSLEKNRSRWIADWIELVKQPSISDTGEGVVECCHIIGDKMKRMGIDTIIHPVKPYPVITGRFGKDPEKKTVLIYAHYDVMPAGDRNLWQSPPFEPTLRDGKLYGRGSADNKSPLMAHLEAFDFLHRELGEVPVNVIFVFEGCEESGSVGLPGFLEAHKEEWQADLVFFSDGPKNEKNVPIIALGAKGIVSIDLVLRTMKKDAHSRFAPVLPSAAWEMVELLGKLKTGDHVNVEGFYDGIIPPSEQEEAILKGLPSVEKEMEAIYGTPIRCGGDENYYIKLNTTPTFNIRLLHSGEGAGVVTSQAYASLDIRLVEGQEPEDIYRKVAAYIRKLGYDNVEVQMKGGVLPSKTPVDHKYVPLIAKVTREVYGDYVIYPCRPSTAPDFLWTRIMGLPAIQVRWSDPDSDNHAPNEHLTIEEYLKGIQLTARVMWTLGHEDAENFVDR